MPRRDDIRKILILGSGPIVIGQACEFDYSGTQALKALREEGYETVLVNSNPATIMTDPEMCDRTYIEPILPDTIEKIIIKEKPDVLLPTLGGQTALNAAIALAESGILEKHGVEMIGATADVIDKAENRERFKAAMGKIGLEVARSGLAHDMNEAHAVLEDIGLPCVIRPSFTLGGSGGGTAFNIEEFNEIAAHGISLSMRNEILIEESIVGWKEYELEVMRDHADNVVIICSIENLDPMGVHTGDSITVAPSITLTDVEYQKMRTASLDIIREIGVETGGSNIQFAVNPADGRMVVIEMNPRVSRSSALASKATGFPIAKIAAKLAVGYTLDELQNDITRETPACFEPTIDYCVVKMPRFAFEKFPDTSPVLTTQMKSVGETMAIGRTFKEALQKAIRGLEIGRWGLGLDRKDRLMTGDAPSDEEIRHNLSVPNADRLFYIRYAIKSGMPIEEIQAITMIDPWFLDNILELVEFENVLEQYSSLDAVPDDVMIHAKRLGFADEQLANAWDSSARTVRANRVERGITPVYKLVDTCAAEFEAYTPYYYSTYEQENEIRLTDKKRILIIGGGPNRIGQGIEFDYCCVHAVFALRELGYEAVMVNSNPETVSTDYDISDKLFFEPLTDEDVLNLCDQLKPDGIIVQFGGQTPLNLARAIEDAGYPIIGTSMESIDRTEDREKFKQVLEKLEIPAPACDTAMSVSEAREIANRIGYPVLVRPSYVLGGRAMEIVYDDSSLDQFVVLAQQASPGQPILIDRFLEDAIEVDTDAVCDGSTTMIGGIMEHIERAGIHSGDSSMTLPPYSLPDEVIEIIRDYTYRLADELNVKGLMNIQYAVKDGKVFVIEVNPRASRTVPFISKAVNLPLAKIAARIMIGRTLEEQGVEENLRPPFYAVKESVFPFIKFANVDIVLGPEMRSTGEAMGIAQTLGAAFAKAELSTSHQLPTEGTCFVSVKEGDKEAVIDIAQRLVNLGFELVATAGTAAVLEANGISVRKLKKIAEGRPNAHDLIINGELDLVINTPSGKGPKTDEGRIRGAALHKGILVTTTIQGAEAAVAGIESVKQQDLDVQPILDYHSASRATAGAATE
jgi:carbamoyl-phosphate synthase large subunit